MLRVAHKMSKAFAILKNKKEESKRKKRKNTNIIFFHSTGYFFIYKYSKQNITKDKWQKCFVSRKTVAFLDRFQY